MLMVDYTPWTLVNHVHAERRGGASSWELITDGDLPWSPALDIREYDDRYVVVVDVPGVDPKELQITVGNGILTVKGHRSQENLEGRQRHVERKHGDFRRSFVLPDTADADRISGSQQNGVVEIVVPKKEEVQPRRIVIN